ncbi:MAG: SoxR reducing system RseC family protein [Salinivirgaceae bacterium]|jgi:sigma-E factor negative regulatory protein RseC|nr:SoxR reducing system RseC family protein [Salinivirgaceae bacterium]
MGNALISHKGIVTSVSNNIILVSITNMSACSSCHAKGACNASDMQEKVVEVASNKKLNIGDAVVITGKESMGFKALFLGYLFPFILVLLTLIIGTVLSFKETTAGLLALSVLVPYYFVLYVTKDRIKKSFIFEIQ